MSVTTATTAVRRRSRPEAGVTHLHRAQIGAFALLVLLTRLPGLVTQRSFNTDENTLGVGGRALADGGALYVDVIDRKPPLPFLAYRIFATTDFRVVRLVVAVLILLAALVVADEAIRRWGHRAGWAAGLVLVLGASALGPGDAQAANFELFALLPIVVAVVAAARGWSATAGVALAVAVLCKQPAAVTIVPVAWAWWQSSRWRGVLRGLAGGAVAALVLTAPFGLSKVLEWALLGTGGYLELDASDIGFALGRLWALVGLTAGFWGGAWLLAAAWRSRAANDGSTDRPAPSVPTTSVPTTSVTATTDRPATSVPATGVPATDEPVVDGSAADRTEADGRATAGAGRSSEGRSADLDLWLLLAVSWIGVVVGFRFFPHYLIQLLAPLALLAGRGAARRPVWGWLALVWGVVASLVAGALSWQVVFAEPPRYEKAVAAYVRARSEPGSEILVWGNVPEIYWLSDRQPAGGFTHSEFITGYSGGRRARRSTAATVPDQELYRTWIARLEADPPVLVVDTAAAYLRGGWWYPIEGYPELARLLRDRYERVATIRGVPVYRLANPRPLR